MLLNQSILRNLKTDSKKIFIDNSMAPFYDKHGCEKHIIGNN